MGFNKCSRYGCKNVMCERRSEKYGYLCNECFDELVNLKLPEIVSVQCFMDSDKRFQQKDVDYYKYYDEEFLSTI